MKPAARATGAWIAFLALCLPLGAQGGKGGERAKKQDPDQKPVKLSWPEMTPRQKDKVELLLKTLGRKGDKRNTKAKAEKQLVKIGLPCAKRLLLRFSDSPHRDINEHLTRVLDQILTKKHGPLLAQQAGHGHAAGRLYVISRLARYHDKKYLPLFKAARKDKNPEVAFHAAMGLATTALDKKALELIFQRCIKEWSEIGDMVTESLQVIRGVEAMLWLRKRINNGKLAEKVAGLRLMRALAPKEMGRSILPYLDSEDYIIKKEAANALRVVVDGKKPFPLEELTVFRIQQLRAQWKARL
ncbi:MAG: HEAT repeat domain-containing protein [Planctomycetota bacterium]|jgi:hypothetical protein